MHLGVERRLHLRRCAAEVDRVAAIRYIEHNKALRLEPGFRLSNVTAGHAELGSVLCRRQPLVIARRRRILLRG